VGRGLRLAMVEYYPGGIKIEVQHYFQKYSGLSWRGKFLRG
jgi:hypothetical protein